MKRSFSLWLALVWVICSWAQTATIIDQESGRPLEGVVLTDQNEQFPQVSNAEGKVDIAPFRSSEKILIRSLGFHSTTTSFSVLERTGFTIALTAALIDLDEVVISATRWRQSTSNIPSLIISIPEKEIALQNPQTAADLLGISGKVFIQKSQQGGGSPMIRGFATNRLIYTVDGVRMNNAIFRSGNLQNVINLDPFAVEKAEVLFGPGAVIYGSDAIGGVMSFQTLTPQLSLSDKNLVSGKALMRYATANNEKTGHFDVNAGWKKWALVTSLSSWNFDHLRQGSNGPADYIKPVYVQRQGNVDQIITQEDPLLQIPSGYDQMNLMQKLRFKPNEKWDLEYGLHWSATSAYGRYDRHNRYRNGAPRYAEWDYGPQKWLMNLFSIRHLGRNHLYDQLTLRLAHQDFEESRIDRTLNRTERNTQTEKVQAYSANLDFVKKPASRHTLYYGLEYVQNDVGSTGLLTDINDQTSQIGPSRYPAANWLSMAAYLQHEFRVSDRFTWQAGARYNQFILDADFSNNLAYFPFPVSTAKSNNGALTGSMGVSYRADDSWMLKANAGTAFRSPNVDDIGKVFDSEPGAVTIPNPDLKAEYAYNFDAGFAKRFGDFMKIELTGFYTILQNALVRRDYLLNGQDSIFYDGILSRVQAIQNAAVAHVYGLQAGLEIKIPGGFGFSTDLNLQKGEEELDDGSNSPSRHAAPFFGVSRISYQANRLQLQFYAMYQGERSFEELPQEEQAKTEIYAKDADGNNYAPSWYTLNLKALYELNDRFRISAGLENLTDQRYRPYSSGISAAGRNFILSASVHF